MRFFTFIFVFFAFTAHAQKGYLIGKVLDQATKQGIELASVTNLNSKELTRTNKQGVFFITVASNDSVEIFSPTHGRAVVQWDGKTEETTVLMKRLDKAIQMQEVKVVSKREQQLKKEIAQVLAEPEARKNLSFGEAAALAQSPITLLYELFSKSAREDRKVAMLMQEKRRRELAHYRFGMVAGQATELSGDGLERFRRFCDLSEEFLLLSSDYELTYEILQCWNVYKRYKK
ncbi:MAG: carboxypeptidase-like regulatory domain-containing protein [Spirosomaceae bacterium]|nr:carboxypeptidase-like regulatory domain-containing protein [Spirosomataceae bacterium]